MIPPLLHPSVRSGAERRLFEHLRDAPRTEDWVCLHSLALAHHETKRRAEIDFLLLTRLGVFVLEVKGGRVARADGLWHFTDRWNNTVSKNEGPFEQASSAMFALEREVRTEFDGDRRRSRLLFGFGVAFPDIEFDVTGVEADDRQVYDCRSTREPIADFVHRLASYWRERSSDASGKTTRYAPTPSDIEALVDFLRGDFDKLPTLSAQADESKRKLVALEAEQYAVLDGLEQSSHVEGMPARYFVQGGAGTGKTLLAAEIAKREAQSSDRSVLLLCFNRVLCGLLEHNLTSSQNITVKTIGKLLREIVAGSSLEQEFRSRSSQLASDEVYRQLLPEYASLAASDGTFQRYDVLVVDEAQDMMSQGVLDALDCCVVNGLRGGRWWVFCDINNQEAVFGLFEKEALLRLIADGQVVVLPTNRRNTIPVATETAVIARPKATPRAIADGIPVTVRFYKDQIRQAKRVESDLQRLLGDGIAPHQITILSPLGPNACSGNLPDKVGLRQVKHENAWKIGSPLLDIVTHATVSSFKGLENDYILLTDVESLSSDWWKGVTYVGMSRARVGLIVYLKDALRDAYEERQKLWLEENRTEDV